MVGCMAVTTYLVATLVAVADEGSCEDLPLLCLIFAQAAPQSRRQDKAGSGGLQF